MANTYSKTMRDALQEAREYRDTSNIEEGHLSYDEWLKQEKGIEKGAHGINSDEHAKYSKEWKSYATASESNLEEIVGGQGEMTVTKDGGVMIIKSKDWQTYKAKGWAKKTNESLDLPATGDTITSKASQEDEGKELNEIWPFGKSGQNQNSKALVKAYAQYHQAYEALKKAGAIGRARQGEMQEYYYDMVTNHIGSREAHELGVKTINGPDRRYGDGKVFQDATR